MTELNNGGSDFVERRRQLLKLGAAGVPMVLTLKASAAEAVHSALDCAFILQDKVHILVDSSGRAWVGEDNIKYKSGKGYKAADISSFKQNASFIFPSGSVPDQFVPEECPPEPDCNTGGGDDWGGGGDDDWSQAFGTLAGNAANDQLETTPVFASWRGDDDGGNDCNNNSGDDDWGGGGGGDDDGGSGGGSDNGWVDCGYNFYKISRNTTITPADYLSNNGSWNLNGENGLYLALAGKYLQTYGNDGGFPGISCLLSILNYLEMQ